MDKPCKVISSCFMYACAQSNNAIRGASSIDILPGKLVHPQKPFFNFPLSCCSVHRLRLSKYRAGSSSFSSLSPTRCIPQWL